MAIDPNATVIQGTPGSDTLTSTAAAETLQGGAGNDGYVFGSTTGVDSLVDTGGANDTVRFTDLRFSDLTITESGDDLVIAHPATGMQVTIVGQLAGTDPVIENLAFDREGVGYEWEDGRFLPRFSAGQQGTGDGDVTVFGDGNDIFYGFGGDDILYGVGGDDNLDGGSGNDLLRGGEGNDQLVGGSGDDNLDGGAGVDLVDGGSGNDTLVGGSGNDRVLGGTGNDVIYGAVGNDSIDGSFGDDPKLNGGVGNDRVSGGNGDDVLDGGSGNDVLSGDFGQDEIDGGAGNDVLSGGSADDVLRGGFGADRLSGDSGNDTLAGGWGNDVLDGGSGQDVAAFNGSVGRYVVERLGFEHYQVTDTAQVGNLGTDILRDIELIRFADQTLNAN